MIMQIATLVSWYRMDMSTVNFLELLLHIMWSMFIALCFLPYFSHLMLCPTAPHPWRLRLLDLLHSRLMPLEMIFPLLPQQIFVNWPQDQAELNRSEVCKHNNIILKSINNNKYKYRKYNINVLQCIYVYLISLISIQKFQILTTHAPVWSSARATPTTRSCWQNCPRSMLHDIQKIIPP